MKNKIIIALSIVVVILLWFAFSKEEIVKTVTTTKIEYVPEISKAEDTKPAEIKTVYIKVPAPVSTVEKITDTVWREKEVKQYIYVDTLSNGVITSTILADNIYKRSVELKTLNKVITNTTTNTVVKDALFLNFGANKYLNNSIRDISISVDFTRKNKWRIGATGGYDLMAKDAFIGLKFGIPLN